MFDHDLEFNRPSRSYVDTVMDEGTTWEIPSRPGFKTLKDGTGKVLTVVLVLEVCLLTSRS